MSMQVIDEDQYTSAVFYGHGKYTVGREKVGTRYVLVAVRTLGDPADPKDMDEVHKLQDAIRVEQQPDRSPCRCVVTTVPEATGLAQTGAAERVSISCGGPPRSCDHGDH